jgi:hypothetical protein
MWGKMTKNILITLFFAFLSYAIVSSIGQPQHTYIGVSSTTIAD